MKGEAGGHVVVAYDYDEITGELYCHMGWGANKTHVTPESSGFTIYRTALVINFNIEHSHSLNYGVTTITNNIPSTQYYCGQDCGITTYEGNNGKEHNTTINYFSSTSHKCECHCGVINTIYQHDLSYSYYTPTQHYKSCSDCLYSGPENHSYSTVSSSSPTEDGHKLACVCGVLSSDYEEHYSYQYERFNENKHYVYCECGYSWTSRHIVSTEGIGFKICIHCGERIDSSIVITPIPGSDIQSASGITYITDAGSYVDADGVIYLVESDMKLYLAGELDVYALADDNCCVR